MFRCAFVVVKASLVIYILDKVCCPSSVDFRIKCFKKFCSSHSRGPSLLQPSSKPQSCIKAIDRLFHLCLSVSLPLAHACGRGRCKLSLVCFSLLPSSFIPARPSCFNDTHSSMHRRLFSDKSRRFRFCLTSTPWRRAECHRPL
jgi:hypothetical protein